MISRPGHAFGGALGDVVLGGLVGGHAHDHDPPQGRVRVSVAAAVEPVAGHRARVLASVAAHGSGDNGPGLAPVVRMRPTLWCPRCVPVDTLLDVRGIDRSPCQRSVGRPGDRQRTCPLVADRTAQRWPWALPVAHRASGAIPFPAVAWGEADTVAGGENEVGVVHEPFDGGDHDGDGFSHESVEPARVQVRRQCDGTRLVSGVDDPVGGIGGLGGRRVWRGCTSWLV